MFFHIRTLPKLCPLEGETSPASARLSFLFGLDADQDNAVGTDHCLKAVVVCADILLSPEVTDGLIASHTELLPGNFDSVRLFTGIEKSYCF